MNEIIEFETSEKAVHHLSAKKNGAGPLTAAPAVEQINVMAAAANVLNDFLPDRFCAGQPQFDSVAAVWQVPVLLSYPRLGVIGRVGEITVSADAGNVLSFTPIDKMKATAETLIEQHREQIEAPLLSAGKA